MRRPAVRVGVCLAVVAILFVVVAFWGRALNEADPDMTLDASPWFGRWRWLPSNGGRLEVMAAVVVAAVVLARWWPGWCARLPERLLAPATAAVGVGWAVLLQATRGLDAVVRPMRHSAEYLAAVDDVTSIANFVSTFVERLDEYPIHVQGHPPGQVVALVVMDRVGLGGPWPATVLSLLSAALATAAVVTVVRWEAGGDVARRAAVFVALTPAVITTATSTDPVFSALAAGAVLATFASERHRGARSIVAAGAAGILAVVAVHFTYAAPLFLAPALLPAWRLIRQRRLGPILAAAMAATVALGAVLAAGFNVFEGLSATSDAYHAGVAAHRPYRFFVLSNLIVLAISVGPAVLAGAARGGLGRLAPLVALTAAAVIVADLTGLSKAEIERIWLPFVPWLALAAVPLAGHGHWTRWWLATQLVTAMTIQLFVRGPW